ncbi:MAG TPA: MOSC domain-containing protein [Beijerinckiaceae bacterium]|nr:MOSC domain-containing protein [Beijerinckiaceae bacterium]
MTASVAFLTRYPVKGLSPEPLQSAVLTAGAHFPGDRMFAIENGPSGFDPAAPVHQPKFKYLMLMRNAALARFQTRYDDASGVLTIRRGAETVAQGDLRTEDGRRAIELFYDMELADDMRGPAKVLMAPEGHRFMDSRSGFVSLLNRATLSAIAAKAGRRGLDPMRFRANIGIDGLPPWGEFDLVGKEVRIGEATLHITKRIDRCAATHVDPATAVRDIDMVGLLEREFGHHDCGVYAEVVTGGTIRLGNAVAAS